MPDHIPDVGAPDPELQTSPIMDEAEDDSMEGELEAGVCYFNGAPYPMGQYVRSGVEVLRCDPPGVWVVVGEPGPDE